MQLEPAKPRGQGDDKNISECVRRLIAPPSDAEIAKKCWLASLFFVGKRVSKFYEDASRGVPIKKSRSSVFIRNAIS